ncbi:MAG: glycine cleavage system protein GcvH [Spirochaetales bacterium]|nr:glycine cleavage system protein GcvH [Spirochaetales bacterium]
MLPKELSYTREHEWLKVSDENMVIIGITDYAQEELGDITFVELPEVGQVISGGDSPVTLESVKAVSSVYSPAAGEIIEVNSRLDDEPELINESPYTDGWIFKIRITGAMITPLLSPGEYQEFIDSLD